MSIDVIFRSKTRQYEIERDGEQIATVSEAHVKTADKPVTAAQLADAFKTVFEAPEHSEYGIIQDKNRKLDAVYAQVGLIQGPATEDDNVLSIAL